MLQIVEVKVKDSFYLLECDDNDVLLFGDDTFKVSKFRKALNNSFNSEVGRSITNNLSYYGVKIEQEVLLPNGSNGEYSRWFDEGIDCEVLNLGSESWKRGKVKIQFRVEFYVEEQETVETPSSDKLEISQIESPLDDLRQMMHENS